MPTKAQTFDLAVETAKHIFEYFPTAGFKSVLSEFPMVWCEINPELLPGGVFRSGTWSGSDDGQDFSPISTFILRIVEIRSGRTDPLTVFRSTDAVLANQHNPTYRKFVLGVKEGLNPIQTKLLGKHFREAIWHECRQRAGAAFWKISEPEPINSGLYSSPPKTGRERLCRQYAHYTSDEIQELVLRSSKDSNNVRDAIKSDIRLGYAIPQSLREFAISLLDGAVIPPRDRKAKKQKSIQKIVLQGALVACREALSQPEFSTLSWGRAQTTTHRLSKIDALIAAAKLMGRRGLTYESIRGDTDLKRQINWLFMPPTFPYQLFDLDRLQINVGQI